MLLYHIMTHPSDHPTPDALWLKRFRHALLGWYKTHKRDMPWRRSDDPYAVWISETMLQQTQVAQARPYFERFMRRFPTVETLAEAPLEEVLKYWAGLGYYARARNLHRAARKVADEHNGRIPDGMTAISALPGVGPYTTAAILSIAYGKDYAVVDGNVTRVLSRLFRISGDVNRTPTRRLLAGLADRLLQKGRAGDFNQAMMELGSTVCTPRQPRCGACPVSGLCRAYNELTNPAELPQKTPRKPRPHHDVTAAVIWRNGRVLIARRPLDGLLGGLWEFPGGRRMPGESLEAGLVRNVAETVGIQVRVDRPLTTVDHAFTHFAITVYSYHCIYVAGDARALRCSDCRWVAPATLRDFAFSRAHNRLIDALKTDYVDNGA